MADELLLHACAHDDYDEAMALLGKRLANVNCATRMGTTPLHEASRSGSSRMVQGLLDSRAEPSVAEVTSVGGKTSLHIAVESHFCNVAMLLLQAQAEPSGQTPTGMTPLHCAALRNCPAAASLLLAFSADPHIRDYEGHNAAHWAAEFRHEKVLEVLTTAGAPPRKITTAEYCTHVLKNQPKKEPSAKTKAAPKKKK